MRVLLYPFAVLFDLITSVRNRLYDLGLKPSAKFEVPVISVGNLAIGGTGKTPLVEHIIRQLNGNYKVATLSRGYGRKTKGFRVAEPKDNASTLGDEPCQFYKKFGDKAVVSVGEDRALAIPLLLDRFPDLQVIILDDAYQHRQVQPLFNVLLTDYHNLFYNDVLLPAGKLRESKKSADRADVVVVTKCPKEIRDDEMMLIEQAIRKYCDKPVFFAGIHYVEPLPFHHTGGEIGETVILVSGIANPKTLADYVKKNFQLIKHFNFADHHVYTDGQVKSIAAYAQQHGASILTTEKDGVKLDREEFKPILSKINCFYIPIEPEFIKSGQDFDEMIYDAISRAQHKRDDHSGFQD